LGRTKGLLQKVGNQRVELLGLADVPEYAAGDIVPQSARPPTVARLGIVEADALLMDAREELGEIRGA